MGAGAHTVEVASVQGVTPGANTDLLATDFTTTQHGRMYFTVQSDGTPILNLIAGSLTVPMTGALTANTPTSGSIDLAPGVSYNLQISTADEVSYLVAYMVKGNA